MYVYTHNNVLCITHALLSFSPFPPPHRHKHKQVETKSGDGSTRKDITNDYASGNNNMFLHKQR